MTKSQSSIVRRTQQDAWPRAEKARALNKKDRCGIYRPGNLTERFDSQEEIIELAIETYRQHFPRAFGLTLDGRAVAEPTRLLACQSRAYMVQVNALAARREKLNWDEHPTELRTICDLWEAINRKFGVTI